MTWDLPDADIRPTLADCDADVAAALRVLIDAVLARHRPLQLFAPAALGPSGDARILFDAVLSLYVEGMIEAEVNFFEDAPAVRGYRQVDEFLSRFEGAYLDVRERYVDVSATFTRKSALIDAFRCAIDPHEPARWQESAERSARISGAAGARHSERYWALTVRGIQ
jgi:hypothetical protein